MDAKEPVLVPSRQAKGPLVRAAAFVLALALVACVPVAPAPPQLEEAPVILPMLPPALRAPQLLA